MNLEAFGGAASIALVSTFAFLMIAKSWHVISKSVGGNGSFRGSIMLEAAQRFRDEMDHLTRRLHVYLTSALVFLVIFAVSYLLRPEDVFRNLPTWQLMTLFSVLASVAIYAGYRFFSIILARRRTEFLRDAAIAAGHGLQKLTANKSRVFHDVSCGNAIIDNVIVGLHGVYAVHVVARKARKDNRVRLEGEILTFAPGKYSLPLTDFGQTTSQLANEFRKILHHEVRVRCVIAVPGWEIESQASADYLVVNERNLAMLRGWKDQNDYLMNEEVEQLQDLLTDRCTRYD